MRSGAHCAQLVMDEIGFIVIQSRRPYQTGHIMKDLFGADGYDDIPGANVVIIGEASLEDLHRQDRILNRQSILIEDVHYYKAIAE